MDDQFDENGNRILRWQSASDFIAHMNRKDKREIETFRPALVISMDNPFHGDGIQRPSVPLGEHLNNSMALAGYSAGLANCDDMGCDQHQFEFESDLDLASLPFLSEPRFLYRRTMMRQLDHTGKRAEAQKRTVGIHVGEKDTHSKLVRDNVKLMVLSSHELTDAFLAKMLGPWIGCSIQTFPTVIHHGVDRGVIVSPERIQVAMERYTAEARFLYNHAINFSELARRALFKIYHDERLSKQEAAKSLPRLGEYHWHWGGPFLLQLLHYLRRLGRVGTDEHRVKLKESVDCWWFAHVYARGLPIFEKTVSGYDWVWPGTGAYPPARMAVGTAPTPEEQDPDALSTHNEHPIFSTFQDIGATGLLGLDGDDIVLSPWGLKFLDIMGAETEDPDVLLRWRTKTGEIGASKDMDAMDAWLARAFGAAKQRVESFVDEMKLYDDPNYFENARYSQKLSVMGVLVSIDEGDLAEPSLAAEIARIGDTEASMPLSHRHYGIVRDPARMGVESRITGIWIGVPLSVTSGSPFDRETGWLRNLDAERREAQQVIEAAAQTLRDRMAEKTPHLMHGIPITAEAGKLRKLPWALEVAEGEQLRPIFLGVTSTVDRTAPVSRGVRRRLSSRSFSQLPEPDVYDGINDFIGKDTNLFTVTCGHFVGLYNDTTGAHLIERELSLERTKEFDRRKGAILANLKAFFAVQKSDYGYWAVLKDGSTRRIRPALQS